MLDNWGLRPFRKVRVIPTDRESQPDEVLTGKQRKYKDSGKNLPLESITASLPIRETRRSAVAFHIFSLLAVRVCLFVDANNFLLPPPHLYFIYKFLEVNFMI